MPATAAATGVRLGRGDADQRRRSGERGDDRQRAG
jgi:hypothetical protein